jgi:hypothetical protein
LRSSTSEASRVISASIFFRSVMSAQEPTNSFGCPSLSYLTENVSCRLEDKGFNHGSSGNVSLRAGEGALITPTGAHSGNLTRSGLCCSTR